MWQASRYYSHFMASSSPRALSDSQSFWVRIWRTERTLDLQFWVPDRSRHGTKCVWRSVSISAVSANRQTSFSASYAHKFFILLLTIIIIFITWLLCARSLVKTGQLSQKVNTIDKPARTRKQRDRLTSPCLFPTSSGITIKLRNVVTVDWILHSRIPDEWNGFVFNSVYRGGDFEITCTYTH
jgi:hypothetical protein